MGRSAIVAASKLREGRAQDGAVATIVDFPRMRWGVPPPPGGRRRDAGRESTRVAKRSTSARAAWMFVTGGTKTTATMTVEWK